MIINPYHDTAGKRLYKGDIHFHTNLSDGTSSPAAMFERLRACGFDFCSPADHDLPNTIGTCDGLVILNGQEMSSKEGHIVALNSHVVRNSTWTVAEQIRQIRTSGGMAILSHPKIREFIADQSITYTADRLINELNLEFDGIEIFTRNVGSGLKSAADRLDVVWTALLDRADFEPVWGFASSDGHQVEHISKNTGIMVWSASPEPNELLASIFSGRFYCIADTQARFDKIALNGTYLEAAAANCRLLKLIGRGGEVVDCLYCPAGGTCTMAYKITGEEGYLRLEAYDAYGRCAYSNPIRIAG